MKKATLEKLEALHGAVADVLAEGLEACKPELVESDDGEFKLVGYDGRLMGHALSFLKDNDITVDHGTVNEDAISQELNKLRSKKRVNNDPFADIPHH